MRGTLDPLFLFSFRGMAQYVRRAEKLKPLIAQAGFTPEQMTLVLRMMRGCATLRQGSVITSFFQMMLPEDMEVKIGKERTVQGYYGPRTYRPQYVIKKGAELVEPQQTEAADDDTD